MAARASARLPVLSSTCCSTVLASMSPGSAATAARARAPHAEVLPHEPDRRQAHMAFWLVGKPSTTCDEIGLGTGEVSRPESGHPAAVERHPTRGILFEQRRKPGLGLLQAPTCEVCDGRTVQPPVGHHRAPPRMRCTRSDDQKRDKCVYHSDHSKQTRTMTSGSDVASDVWFPVVPHPRAVVVHRPAPAPRPSALPPPLLHRSSFVRRPSSPCLSLRNRRRLPYRCRSTSTWRPRCGATSHA